MRVRIIAGKFGGRVIGSPGTYKTHPMSERARGAIFNMLSKEIVGAKVLDGFAGTGALGLEALSRGASSATFVERDMKALRILKENVELLGAENETRVIGGGLGSWLAGQDEKYDVVFSDPPYGEPQWGLVQKLADVLDEDGLLLASFMKGADVATLFGVRLEDERTYADASVRFYRKI